LEKFIYIDKLASSVQNYWQRGSPLSDINPKPFSYMRIRYYWFTVRKLKWYYRSNDDHCSVIHLQR